MGVGAIAREAFIRVSMLEKALISKKILTEGEAKQLYDDEIKKQSEERTKLIEGYWEQLHDGDYIQLFPYMAKPLEGTLVAKSAAPFRAICLRINERGSYHKRLKKDGVECFTDITPQDILVRSMPEGNFVGISPDS